jgi:carbamoyl-phosphate synthase small subunit
MGRIAETKVPVLGVCLGSQIIALSLGGDTYKLKFGHRGQNHPCIDLDDGRCYITSQNHGFAVDAESVRGTGLRVTFVNANDGTVEGVAHEEKSIFGVQFHPEASPGPKDTDYVFDRFLKAVREYAGADSSRQKG